MRDEQIRELLLIAANALHDMAEAIDTPRVETEPVCQETHSEEGEPRVITVGRVALESGAVPSGSQSFVKSIIGFWDNQNRLSVNQMNSLKTTLENIGYMV